MLTKRQRRKYRTRNKIISNNKLDRSRVVVTRSNKNIYAQLIDVNGNVLKSCSTLSFEDKATGLEKAKKVGMEFAKLCIESNISSAVFDKGQYIYGGRVKALAEGCREAGLKL